MNVKKRIHWRIQLKLQKKGQRFLINHKARTSTREQSCLLYGDKCAQGNPILITKICIAIYFEHSVKLTECLI